MMYVFAFPPRESRSKKLSLEEESAFFWVNLLLIRNQEILLEIPLVHFLPCYYLFVSVTLLLFFPIYYQRQNGRVVKALDLSSNGRMSTWV